MVADFYVDKFIQSVKTIQKVVGVDLLDEKKRYCLRKLVTNFGWGKRAVKSHLRKM